MVRSVHTRSADRRTLRNRAALVLCALAALVAMAALAGCGSSIRDGAEDDARADIDTSSSSGSCAATVLDALGHVAERVYSEGVSSERTLSATRMIEGSATLRAAVEADNVQGARIAAHALLATGHLTNLRVIRGNRVLVDVGGRALAPLGGTLENAAGRPIAHYVTSVWADSGLIAETNGIAEGLTLLRDGRSAINARTLAGEFGLPDGELPQRGTLTHDGSAYEFTSFAATSYPAGSPLRIYLLRSIDSTAALCGASSADTTFNTISRVAHLIYEGEAGRRTLTQIHRVQQNAPLLHAVAHRDRAATRAAVAVLLHHHIVRLRVSAGKRLLADDGGPFVLAPVTAPLRLGGRTVGSVDLSIQDDEGYKRLASRLAGLEVLMYMGSRLVKSTLGPSPGPIPQSGPVSFRGRSFRAYTFDAAAFPSGPLRITVLIPLPYS
jgi:hypothetical protein